MRFSGRKGDLEVFLSGSDPDARDKEKRQILFACKRRKRKKGTRRGKLPQICDRNEKAPLVSPYQSYLGKVFSVKSSIIYVFLLFLFAYVPFL